MDAQRKKTLRTLTIAFAALASSSLLAVFAVPLYKLFCQVTGYGGTTQQAGEQAREVLDREVELRFDATVDGDLPWRMEPVQTSQTVKLGETALAFYRVTNTADRAVTGRATYNVTPHKAGAHFRKVECFCFSQQTLAPGESTRMPVTYFIEPAMDDEANLDEVTEVTLSYTFFFVEYAGDRVAAASGQAASGQ